MTDILVVIVQVALIICVADLISGVAHWAQDRFDTRSIPVFNELFIYKANEHHLHPNRSSQYSWLTRNKYALIISTFFIFPAWLCSFLSWQYRQQFGLNHYPRQGNKSEFAGTSCGKPHSIDITEAQPFGFL